VQSGVLMVLMSLLCGGTELERVADGGDRPPLLDFGSVWLTPCGSLDSLRGKAALEQSV
jgi:hypothetical protein